MPNYKSPRKYLVVPDSIQDSEVVGWRYGAMGEFAESQPATPIGGMEPTCGGVLGQRAAGKSMVPGK